MTFLNFKFLYLIVVLILLTSCRNDGGKAVLSSEKNNDTQLKMEASSDDNSMSSIDQTVSEITSSEKDSIIPIVSAQEEQSKSKGIGTDYKETSPIDTSKKSDKKSKVARIENVQSTTSPSKDTRHKAIISFDKTVFDYDTIVEGDVIKYKFKFENTGSGELNISKTNVSCGCTVPSFPFLSIPAGEEGEIGVEFHSIGKEGEQESKVTVFSDAANKEVILTMKGYVKLKSKNSK